MSDLSIPGKSSLSYDQVRRVDRVPVQPVRNRRDEVYFRLGQDLYVAEGRAMAGIQDLAIGDWIEMDGERGQVVRVDMETTPQERIFAHSLSVAVAKVQGTPHSPECADYFRAALCDSLTWQQALEVGAAAAEPHTWGHVGQVASQAFATAVDRCAQTDDCLSVARSIPRHRFFGGEARMALRKALRLATTPGEFQAVHGLASELGFGAIARRADRRIPQG